MKKYDVLVLSGGGSKAIAHLGALQYYYEIGKLDFGHVQEYRGTSAGSIICALLLCGYTPMEIMNYIYTLNHFIDDARSGGLWDVFKKKGLMPVEKILSHVEKMILDKLGFVPTMLELYKMKKKRLLLIPTIDVTENKCVDITYKTFPDLPITKALAMSSNLPLIFQELVYKDHLYLDGGLANNFPVDGIDDSKLVLGVIVTGTDSVPSGEGISFLTFLYRAMMFPVNTLTLQKAKNLGDNYTIIKMVIDDVPVMELQMANDRKMRLFTKGFSTAKSEDNKLLLNVDGWCEDHKTNNGWDIDIDLW